MTAQNVIALNNSDYAVIDLDSGTVLGTNVVLVRIPEDEQTWEDVTSNDSEAWEYGQEHGIPLIAEV